MSIGVIVLLIVVATTVWVGVDASRRDWQGGTSTVGWVAGCIVLWIVFFPIYLAKRGSAPLKEQPSSRGTPGAGLLSGGAYRECPRCKEPMRRDADTCPHCRQESEAWRLHEGHWWRRDEQGRWLWLDEQSGVWAIHEPGSTAPAAQTT
jgi:hypothetical protein